MNEICPKLQQALGVAVLAARLAASSLAPQTSQMVSRHWPTTCEGKANDQVSDFLFSLEFSLIGTYLMFQARSANRGQAFETLLQTEICSEICHGWIEHVHMKTILDINVVLIFSNGKLSGISAFS